MHILSRGIYYCGKQAAHVAIESECRRTRRLKVNLSTPIAHPAGHVAPKDAAANSSKSKSLNEKRDLYCGHAVRNCCACMYASAVGTEQIP